MRTPNFRSAAYSTNFQIAPAVARVDGSGIGDVLQRARKIPDYRSAYIGNFQMATNINNKNLAPTPTTAPAPTVEVKDIGTTDV
jgi:hypothetical protein